MTTKEVAQKLVTMCRDGKIEEAKVKLFTEETMSIEPGEGLLLVKTIGLKDIQKKAELFISMVDEFYGSTISDPLVAGGFFTVRCDTDIKMKGHERNFSSEICLYKVKDGKILSEEFFY